MTPVAEGLFEGEGDHARLVGSRCRSCGALYFPQSLSCRNPDCREKAVERAPLPQAGVLHSYTIQRYRPPPLFRADGWEPYAIGLVDLGEGLRVMGMMTGVALDEVAIGMPVRVVVEPLFRDDGRGEVATYKFAPDDRPGAGA